MNSEIKDPRSVVVVAHALSFLSSLTFTTLAYGLCLLIALSLRALFQGEEISFSLFAQILTGMMIGNAICLWLFKTGFWFRIRIVPSVQSLRERQESSS